MYVLQAGIGLTRQQCEAIMRLRHRWLLRKQDVRSRAADLPTRMQAFLLDQAVRSHACT